MSGVPVRHRFGKSNPCKVCGKGSSFCAERIDGMVMCGHSREAHLSVAGWKFIRNLGASMGGLWAPASLFSEDDLSNFGSGDSPLQLPTGKGKGIERPASPSVIEEAPKEKTAPKGLPENARAAAHKNLSKQLELSEAHRRTLINKRGLSGEQVEKLEREGFRSIDHGQRFPGVKGAGFHDDGQYLGPAGLLIPARNDDGEIIGYQIAPDHPGDGGKYKWISGPDNPVGIDQEWPVFQGQTDRETSMSYMVDGALKAALTGMLYDVPTAGVPGARFTTSGTQLLRVLAKIMPTTQDERLVVLMPDAGDVVNLSDMPSNLDSVASYLREHGYTVRFGWWGQVHKDGDQGVDIDEKLIVRAEDGSQIQYLTPDQFHQIVTDMAGKAPRRVMANPKVGVRWVDKSTELPTLEITPPPREAYQFPKGKRIEVLSSLQERARFVLDRSKPGSGKSYDITHADPRDFGGAQIVMVARRAMDVGNEFGVPALRGKDAGRMVNETGRMVRAPIGADPEDLAMGPNCALAETVEAFIKRGMQLHSANICTACKHRHACGTNGGMFKFDKKETLKASTYVCEPEALDFKSFCASDGSPWTDPLTQEPGTILMIDESASMPWVDTTEIDVSDITAHSNEMGLPMNRVRFNTSFLKVLDSLSLLVMDSSEELIPHDRVMDHIDRTIREGEIDVLDATEISIMEETLLSKEGCKMKAAWSAALLETLFGRGRLWISNGKLFLMRPNHRFVMALNHPAVRQVVFFDGTGAVTELEGWLEAAVEVVEERAPAEQATLNITQYAGMGRLGFTRKRTQEKQTEELLSHLRSQGVISRNTPVVDIKRSNVARSRKPLTWLSTSRGSNEAAKAEDLVIVGAPGPNLVSALNRYCLLYGVDVSLDDIGFFHRRFWTASATRNEGGGMFLECAMESPHTGFRNYYRALIEAELDQALHRLRGVRRPGEILRVHWVSDFCHPRWEVTLKHADEVVDVYTPVGLTVETVEDTLRQLKSQNVSNPTHHRVASELGVRGADVARWIESDPEITEKFGWLDRSRKTSRQAVPQQEKKREPKPSQPREPVPDQMLTRMREMFPIGTKVTCLYDRSKIGSVVEYSIERGLPKFVVEMEDGRRSSFPRNLLTFPALTT